MKNRMISVLFATAVFVSAFLLFQIQPLISKSILPWFGGTPNVWTTCLLFFQSVLFGGYVYAHLLTQKLNPRWQAIIHSTLLLVAIILVSIIPDDSWKPTGAEPPVFRILCVLLASVGLPYFVLSTTGPLLQAWFAQTCPGKSPYRLYSLSNTGSLLALLSFPFVFEPMVATSELSNWWMFGFLILGALCCVCGWLAAFTKSPEMTPTVEHDNTTNSTTRTGGNAWQWFGLSMTASVMLLATTNQVCQDVAVIPFLWVVPLSLYLLTFILCFDSDRWYSRLQYGLFGALSIVLVTYIMMQPAGTSLALQLVVYFGALFLSCMVCHGELAALKPEPKRLTSFYLTMSAGGAAGGIFVAVVAPLIFPLFLEMHLALAVCAALTVGVYLNANNKRPEPQQLPVWGHLGAIGAVIGLMISLQSNASATMRDSKEVQRNFYGVLRIEEQLDSDPEKEKNKLLHGRILHGVQFVAANKAHIPTTYYGNDSGIGRIIEVMRGPNAEEKQQPLRVGVVGLGVGTLATYGITNDLFRFYEINDSVVRLAQKHFTFLKDTLAETEMVLGDARLMMEREQDQNYDLLVLDAFSGDSVPAHLLTKEVMQVYTRHLNDDGVLAIHISNLHFDLRPVTSALVEDAGLNFVIARGYTDNATAQVSNLWLLASKDSQRLQNPRVQELAKEPPAKRVLWTDDFSDLFSVLK